MIDVLIEIIFTMLLKELTQFKILRFVDCAF